MTLQTCLSNEKNTCIKNFKVSLAGLMKIVSPSYVKKYNKMLLKSLKVVCFRSQFIATSSRCGNNKDFSQNPIGIWTFQEVQLLQAKYPKTLIHIVTECENMLQLFNLISPR